MSAQEWQVRDLQTLNEITETLNRSVDVRGALEDSLAHLVGLMGLETGWIFLLNESASERWWGRGYRLAAHHNLPPALDLANPKAWDGGCDCQGFCNTGKLTEAYNEVRCTRLEEGIGSRRGLKVHASAPLRSAETTLGILNVAAADWDSFSRESLALLTHVGGQMAVALERARLYDLLQESRMLEQSALLEMSNQLLSRLELDDLIDYLVEKVADLLRVDACALFLSGARPDQLAFRAAYGWRSSPSSAGQLLPLQAISPGPLFLERTSLSTTDEQVEQLMQKYFAEEEFLVGMMVPLLIEDEVSGALLVNAREERSFGRNDTRFLQLMANQAAIAIEKARLHQEEVHRKRLEDELEVGRRIQLSMLPKACPVIEGWQIRDFYRPARQVGGDFYDFFELPNREGYLGMVIGDVSDKGVAAALFMAVSRTLMRSAALSSQGPAMALQTANKQIAQESHAGMFLSAHYSVLDFERGHLVYASAGHNPPLHYAVATGEMKELGSNGLLLCILDEFEFEEKETQIEPGDVLFFYTDGVTEAMNRDLEEFGLDRLKEVVLANADQDAGQLVQTIVEEVDKFSGDHEPSDDLTLFVVKRLSLDPPDL